MQNRFSRRLDLCLVACLALLCSGCGGGRTAVIGLGNSGNRIIEAGLLGEVADSLAEHPGTPRVSDEMLAEVFQAILGRAQEGDPEAALIVLQVAEQQRVSEG